MTTKQINQRFWYKALLTPMAQGIFTEAFYPDPKKRTGAQYVFFTQEDVTPAARKVIIASKMAENGLRMMTLDLAQKCLVPLGKATKLEMATLNGLASKLKF